MTKKKKAKPKGAKEEKTKPKGATKKKCFVIMPFSKTENHDKKYWTNHYDNYLKPLIERNRELEAHRSEALRSDILKGIVTSLVNDPIVVADLTDLNANVFLELGIRLSFMHGTITIMEDGTDYPFDLGTKGTLTYYPKDINVNAKFEKQFHNALSDCLTNPDRPDSHVLETLSGRGSLYAIINRNMIKRRLEALESEIEDNEDLIHRIKERSNINLESEDKQYITSRFRKIAIELLVKNRYIDEDSSFYNLSEIYFDSVNLLNDQLNLWGSDKFAIDEWFSEHIDIYVSRLVDFKVKFDEIHNHFRDED